MSKTIGIYHQIDLEALELLASLRAKDADDETVRDETQRLGSQIGISEATIRRRTAPARKAWIGSDSPLVERAASMFLGAGEDERLALHVAVLIRAYPFFFDVLTNIGKAKQLGSTVRLATVRDRITRAYGQKGNVHQGVQKAIQTLVSWELLEPNEKPGSYHPTDPIPVSVKAAELLVGCTLEAGDKDALPLEGARRQPGLFPFEMPPLQLREDSVLTQFSEGGNKRFVRLAGRLPSSDGGPKSETSERGNERRLDEF